MSNQKDTKQKSGGLLTPNSTTNTYQMKREILNFSNRISKHLSKPDKKFSADMTYGMLAAGSCLLTDVVDQLHENTKKVSSVERLTRHLNNGTSSTALKSYLTTIRKWVPATLLRNQRKGRILFFSSSKNIWVDTPLHSPHLTKTAQYPRM